jgi:transposase InsO family protein
MEVDAADLDQHGGFARVVAYQALDRQRLVVIVQCLLILAKGGVDSADIAQRPCFARPVGRLATGRRRLLEWMLWYNGSRMHSTLRYLSPAQFEQQALASQIALAA